MKKAALCALTVLLLAAGCGGETRPSQTEDGRKVVGAVGSAITAPDQGVSAADATCIATRFVDALDVAPLVEEGVVTKGLSYVDGSVAKDPSSQVGKAYTKAYDSCLEAKVARSMAAKITTADGLIRADHASCVARAFAHDAGLAKLIAGQVVTTQLEYVANGAIQDPENAQSFASALVDCIGKTKVTDSIKKTVEAAFASGVAGGPTTGTNVSCLVDSFVKEVGVEGVIANRLITDLGTFNPQRPKYDSSSATALATSILGCVDAIKSQAQAAAAANPKIDEAALEACLRKAISPEYLRDEFLVNQLTGRNKQAQAASAQIEAKSKACERAQK